MKPRILRLGMILNLMLVIGGCQTHSAPIAEHTSLAGPWKATLQQAFYCDALAPMKIKEFNFQILDAPLLNRTVSSLDYRNANVTGTVSASIDPEGYHPETVISGLLIGAIVENKQTSSPAAADPSGVVLKGYIVSKEQYGSWVENKNHGMPPTDAGEVELQVSGNALSGYTLNGFVRSAETCANVDPLNPVVQYLTGHFGRGVPSKWSVRVVMTRS